MFLTENRDVNFKILDYLDDRSLLEACKTDKRAQEICNDEGFWRRRYFRVYGEEAASYKMSDRSWKNYYLLTLHYDAKYFPFLALNRVAKKGYLDLVKFFILKVKINGGLSGSGLKEWEINSPLTASGEGGHLPVIEFLASVSEELHVPGRISQMPYSWAFNGAASGGKLELMKYLLETKGIDNIDSQYKYGAYYRRAFEYAVKNNHRDVVIWLLKMGSREFDWVRSEQMDKEMKKFFNELYALWKNEQLDEWLNQQII